jgi:hypothetical protein
MGMLQKYRNKLRQDERKAKRKLIDGGEVATTKIKVKLPAVGKAKKK